MSEPLTGIFCELCAHTNVLDNRAPKCRHYCRTCASIKKRIANCKEHPK